jgi:transcriptional regulator with XRE-family HTH domain
MAKAKQVERLVLEFDFGDRVRKARQHIDMTATELSLKLGLSKTAVTYWEHGGRPRDLVDVAMKVADITGVDLMWLLAGDSSTRRCLCNQEPCVCDLGILQLLATDSQLPTAS